ncbi:thiamine phosphate synthase [Paenibacillus sp. SI8]|uniref:thiamine phosphate synthase n=1 Tax=unclassified Paenibacillus TaxID=185978 RepID=UPI003465046C
MAAYELHVISNGRQDWTAMSAIAVNIQPYVTAIHLREKSRPVEEMMKGLQILLAAGVAAKRVYINGHPSLAAAALLGGTHLQGSSPPLPDIRETDDLGSVRTGVSVHSVEEAVQREKEGADYLMFGHIFTTDSKPGLAPRGLEQLRELTANVKIPVIAIGGITPERVNPVLEAGASGVAVMSGIWDAENPLQAVKAYADELKIIGGNDR